MKAELRLPDVPAVIEAALEGLVLANLVMMDAGLIPPFPHNAEVIYRLEPPGEEDWKLAHNVIGDGWGDCEDLAGWSAAGLRFTGQDPGATVALIRTGVNKLHAVVRLSNGEVWDPSRELLPRKAG